MRAPLTRTPDLSPRHRDFDDLLGRFFGTRSDQFAGAEPGCWLPPLESFTRDGELVVRIDVPGIDPQAIDISVEKDRLTVKGERKSSREDDKNGRVYREVAFGSFERSVMLPWQVEADNVKASCRDGVLEIAMKAPEKAGAKKIPVVQ